ncbi:protein I'm not dead yet isoform X2 [Drosophila biarmipes]|nr:protein I'm not dead yet isoform X2 [Drosophila biarmipes]
MARGAVAFIYIIFIPVAGIASSNQVGTSYYNDLIFLVYGSIFLGIMMESSRLNERLAMCVIAIVGSSLKLLQIFMTVAVFIVAFLVHPALAAAFWMKVSQAVITEYNNAGILKMNSDERTYEVGAKPYPTRPVIGIYLTCCYTGTLAACFSPFVNPNGSIADAFWGLFSVTSMMMIMAAPAIMGLVVMVLWIHILFLGLFGGSVKRDLAELAGNKAGFKQAIADRKEALGPWPAYPIIVLFLIIVTFLLVATRKPRVFRGWDDINLAIESGFSVAVIGMAIVFFALPTNYLFCKYYVCRRPSKEGTAPSLLGWKAVNNNTPWADVFMLGAAVCCIFCAQACGFIALVAESLGSPDDKFDGQQFIVGALFGTLLTNLSPGTTVAKIALPAVARGGASFALPFATALHNQFLLPVSCPANIIVAGWGNIRPFQFMLAGSVLMFFMFVTIAGFTALLGSSALPLLFH